MKKTYFLFLLIFAVQFVGCYEDKGNYDYKDIQEVGITFKGDKTLKLIFGETIKLEPIISPEIKANSAHHKFTWYVNGETREEWNSEKFEWVVDRIFKGDYVTLEIEDTRNGMIYMGRINADVVGPYESEHSWMILSDNNGVSQLSYFSCIETDEETLAKHILFKKTKFFEDVYTDVNNGMELGRGPMRLQEHYRGSVYNPSGPPESIIGNVYVFQESGAVDLSGESFEKVIDMKDAFDGGVLPNILYPGSPMDYLEIISDIEGKLYKRVKKTDVVYESEYYLQDPMQYNDEILEKCMVCRGYYRTNRSGYAVIYDGKNKRLLCTINAEPGYDENWRPEDFIRDAGRMLEFPAGYPDADLTKFIPLNNFTGYEVLGIEMGTGDLPDSSDDYAIFMLLRHEASNNMFVQKIILQGSDGQPAVVDVKLHQIKGIPAVPKAYAFPQEDPQVYTFFAVGTTLYMMDLQNPGEAVTVYYNFDANITALNCQSFYDVHLAVGLEDGSFFVLDIVDAKNITDIEKRVIYESEVKVGRIVDIKYKQLDHWNY